MMNRLDIVRAWKDEEYRSSLTDAQRAALPGNPVGMVELNGAGLEGVAGGGNTKGLGTTSPAMCQSSLAILCPPRHVFCISACKFRSSEHPWPHGRSGY